MPHAALVALGAAIGAVARFRLGGFVLHHTPGWRFPLGTFLINLLGCLLAGLIAGAVVRHSLFSSDTRLFLLTGVLGGFTTFSAFGLETVDLLQRGHLGVALGYVTLSVLGGIGAVWLGMAVIPHGST